MREKKKKKKKKEMEMEKKREYLLNGLPEVEVINSTQSIIDEFGRPKESKLDSLKETVVVMSPNYQPKQPPKPRDDNQDQNDSV